MVFLSLEYLGLCTHWSWTPDCSHPLHPSGAGYFGRGNCIEPSYWLGFFYSFCGSPFWLQHLPDTFSKHLCDPFHFHIGCLSYRCGSLVCYPASTSTSYGSTSSFSFPSGTSSNAHTIWAGRCSSRTGPSAWWSVILASSASFGTDQLYGASSHLINSYLEPTYLSTVFHFLRWSRGLKLDWNQEFLVLGLRRWRTACSTWSVWLPIWVFL